MPDKKERQKGNDKIAVHEVSGNLLNNNSLWIKISNWEGIHTFFGYYIQYSSAINLVFVKVCSDFEKVILSHESFNLKN